MPVNMALAALLMSGAIQTGQPAAKLTLGGDVILQPNGAAPTVIQAAMNGKKKGGKKGGKKKSSYPRRL
jgi:hypothetical protein